MITMIFNAQDTAAALPYQPLADCIKELLQDASVSVPPRLVHAISDSNSLFVMPASDRRIAITKLITFVADNASRQLPAIQGDVVVFDAINGQRLCMLDGPTVTARRTAAVSLLAAQLLAPKPDGKLLIVGAGVQGRSHLEAFAQGLGVKEVRVASRSRASAQALVEHAIGLGLQAQVVDNADQALAECSLVVTATSAQQIAMRARPRDDAFVCAVGAFSPRMVEWAPRCVCTWRSTGASWWIRATLTMKPVIYCKPVWMCRNSPVCKTWFNSRKHSRIQQARCFSKAAVGRAGIWPPRVVRCKL